MDNLLTVKEYEIHYYEVGFNKEANITTIINLFQDVFVFQLENIGMGLGYLDDHSITWMVLKWDIQIFKKPIYGEKIKIKMYPISLKKFYMYIRYQVLNENGEILAEAVSSWMLIDTMKGKPQKITEELYSLYGLTLDDNVPIPIDKINLTGELELKKTYNVGYSDIDTNGHANNSKYISWALNAIPENIIKDYKLTRIKIDYKKGISSNKIIFSAIKIIKDEKEEIIRCLHKIYTKDNVTLTVLESIWETNTY